MDDYLRIVKEELPEILSQVKEAAQKHRQNIEDQYHAARRKEVAPSRLPPGRTDYYAVYTLVTRHWAQLKGLQSRQRIWADCQEILRRVDGYRAEGRLDAEGITEDLREIVLNHKAKQGTR